MNHQVHFPYSIYNLFQLYIHHQYLCMNNNRLNLIDMKIYSHHLYILFRNIYYLKNYAYIQEGIYHSIYNHLFLYGNHFLFHLFHKKHIFLLHYKILFLNNQGNFESIFLFLHLNNIFLQLSKHSLESLSIYRFPQFETHFFPI